MGYPNDILETRAVIKPGLYAVIPPKGLVNNVIPGIEGCKISIVASPEMGASFVQYIVQAQPRGKTIKKFGAEEEVETFIYCIDGCGEVIVDEEEKRFSEGNYLYSPPGKGVEFKNTSEEVLNLLLYKQLYTPLAGVEPRIVYGDVNKIEYRIYDEMENVYIKDLLPTDLGFDMNMHILSFAPGGCHPFVETHVQEHGAYVLEGEGVYLLDNEWMPIKKEDYIWFGPYVSQGAYGVGRENFTYIYSKGCNRDAKL
jgi:(S)-ureidoglycine aminohydrolase